MRSTGGEYENEFVRTAWSSWQARAARLANKCRALRTKAANYLARADRFATNAELRYDFDEWIATKVVIMADIRKTLCAKLGTHDDDRARGVRK